MSKEESREYRARLKEMTGILHRNLPGEASADSGRSWSHLYQIRADYVHAFRYFTEEVL